MWGFVIYVALGSFGFELFVLLSLHIVDYVLTGIDTVVLRFIVDYLLWRGCCALGLFVGCYL